jgi:acyl-CoA synthetase (NDP forming)
MLDELAAGALIERLGVRRVPSVVVETGTTQAPALPFSYPVAVKVLSADIAHKSDVGGVALDVGDGAALVDAIRKIATSVAERKPGALLARVLVQPMVAGLGEVLVGYRVDRDVGPLIMVAAGGVLTEIARDRSLRLAPVDLAAARAMIAEVRGLVPLAGYRGRPKGDLDALAHAIVALARFAEDTSVAEAEINPLMVLPAGEGVVAVDALVKLAGSA